MTAHGLATLREALGRPLTSVRRYVLGLGESNDEFGHGVTELGFAGVNIVVRAGPNEDYLVFEEGPFDARGLDLQYWTGVDVFGTGMWRKEGRLQNVDVYSDGADDVALVFLIDSGDQFSITLCDTDVALSEGLEPFASDPNQVKPVLRTTVS